jgi:hypothetical protein
MHKRYCKENIMQEQTKLTNREWSYISPVWIETVWASKGIYPYSSPNLLGAIILLALLTAPVCSRLFREWDIEDNYGVQKNELCCTELCGC